MVDDSSREALRLSEREKAEKKKHEEETKRQQLQVAFSLCILHYWSSFVVLRNPVAS